MNAARRRYVLLSTLALAVLWLPVLWHADSPMIELIEAVLRVLIVIGAVSWMILSVTAPALETARVWLEIGKAMEKDRCDCPCVVADLNATVVQLRRS